MLDLFKGETSTLCGINMFLREIKTHENTRSTDSTRTSFLHSETGNKESLM